MIDISLQLCQQITYTPYCTDIIIISVPQLEIKMENPKTRQRQLNQIRLTRTIDNKRTITSEPGHNHNRNPNPRKFTIQYLEAKKSIRQPLMQRKNQSLPRALANSSQNSLGQQNIRSRKLIYSSHSAYNDHKSSNPTIPSCHNHSELKAKIDLSKNRLFAEGIELFIGGKYEEAVQRLLEVQKECRDGIPKCLYYLGLSYWHLGHTEKSVMQLSKALDLGYQFSTQSYQLLSTFYQQSKNYNCALKTLDHWLKVESSSKAHLMRARIYFLFKQYAKAIADYGECYRIESTKLEAYIEEAEAMYRLKGLQPAIEKYNQLLVEYNRIWPQSQHSDINYVKYKKSLLLLHQKQYTQSLSLLQQVTNPQLQSQVSYYIGIIHSVLGHAEQATLAFAKSIQASTSDKFVGQSYYEKFVLMFKKHQYYAIQYELDIVGDRYGDNEALQVLRAVIEGIIYVLKMNFHDGIRVLNSLSDNPCYVRNSKIYASTVSSFKIFSYYSLHKFDEAFEQFTNLNASSGKNKRISDSNRYNYSILKAIRAANNREYNEALKLFDEAEKIESFNTHTFMVKAIVQILFYNSLDNDIMEQEASNQEILLSAQQLLNRCLQKQLQNDQLLYILAVINYQLSQYESGLKLIRKAIESSDDHTIKHYYLKANLKVMLEMEPQAINDYTNAIMVMVEQQGTKFADGEETAEKQEPIYECYLERAKCYIKDGNMEKAEADLRTFFSQVLELLIVQLQNVKKYEQELSLFMHVGCSDVILDIYKSILQQQYQPYGKMKCYYLSKQLNNCLNMMNLMLEFGREDEDEGDENYNVERLAFDRDCLEALKRSSQGSTFLIQQSLNIFQQKLGSHTEGEIFKKSDCLFYAGVMSFHLEQYGKAKNYFIDSKSQKLQSGQICRSEQQQQPNIENQTFSLQQINYNIGICDYIQHKWSNYLEEYPQFRRNHQAVTQNLVKQVQEITPFVVKNRLCSIYPPEISGCVSYRLSFCLPTIKLDEVKFRKSKDIIRSIGFRDIAMRPSAPWIQKSKKGIMFTSDVMKESIDLKSQKSKKIPNGKKKGQQRYKDKEQSSQN